MMMLLLLLLLVGVFQSTATIDRQAVVERHTPTLTCSSWKSKECNPLDFQTLGNGALAFSVDVTGLQTFNATLQSGGLCNPLNTMAEWGWHTTPVEKSLQFANATPHDFECQPTTILALFTHRAARAERRTNLACTAILNRKRRLHGFEQIRID